MSAARVEQLPFVSNYPMYSGTYESEEEFNAESGKFDRYRFEAAAPGVDPPT